MNKNTLEKVVDKIEVVLDVAGDVYEWTVVIPFLLLPFVAAAAIVWQIVKG